MGCASRSFGDDNAIEAGGHLLGFLIEEKNNVKPKVEVDATSS
jgi:hypothetical protein